MYIYDDEELQDIAFSGEYHSPASTFPDASPSATTLSHIPGPPLTSPSSIELGRGRAEESQGSISLAPSASHRIGETIHPRPSTVTGATGTTQSRSRPRSRVETVESGGLYSNWRERWGRLNAASGGVRRSRAAPAASSSIGILQQRQEEVE